MKTSINSLQFCSLYRNLRQKSYRRQWVHTTVCVTWFLFLKCSICFQVFMYTGACVGILLLAIILITLGLTNISTVSTSSDVKSLVQQVMRQIFFSTTQHLLIFPTLLNGLSQGFLVSDFTQVILDYI